MTQLSLDLRWLQQDDLFLLSDCNEEAYRWVRLWPQWPTPFLLIYGPPACGKSHLGRLWHKRSHSVSLKGRDLSSDFLSSYKGEAILLEDLDNITDESLFFHLYNLVKEKKGHLLILTRYTSPSFTLPDADSRLKSIIKVAIRDPDDSFIEPFLTHRFRKVGLRVPAEVISYLSKRIGRSYEDLQDWVERIHQRALSQHRDVTIPFLADMI